MTFEAFADTLVPGERRCPEDRAVAGAAEGGGAVVAGAVDLLQLPEVGLVDALHGLAQALNGHARTYAEERGLRLDPTVPEFVSLPFSDRTTVIRTLTATGHPEKEIWVVLAVFCTMAFDSAAHMPTEAAVAAGHPGLATVGFSAPDPDGLWRFSEHSYGRQLASLHPRTSPSGSPS
ncbi:MAG: DUF5987 family protein [Micromonosporaceae bacterium]